MRTLYTTQLAIWYDHNTHTQSLSVTTLTSGSSALDAIAARYGPNECCGRRNALATVRSGAIVRQKLVELRLFEPLPLV
jgi:hypothetical protein